MQPLEREVKRVESEAQIYNLINFNFSFDFHIGEHDALNLEIMQHIFFQ
jgi:hypothetical protein